MFLNAQGLWEGSLYVIISLLDCVVEKKGFPQGAAPAWTNLLECQVAVEAEADGRRWGMEGDLLD